MVHSTLLGAVILGAATASFALGQSPSSEHRTAAASNVAIELDTASAAPTGDAVDRSQHSDVGKRSAGDPSEERLSISRPMRSQHAAPKETPWYRNGLVAVGLVFVAIAATATVAKRLLKGAQVSGVDILKVLARTHLTPKQSIALVQMGGKLVFVGITPESISALRVVDGDEESALLRARVAGGERKTAGRAFRRLLQREAEQYPDESDRTSDMPEASFDQISQTRENLKEVIAGIRRRGSSNLSESEKTVT